jgi:FMN phosphatase YigB (HAD superfamily)
MIGDSEADIIGAARASMHSIWLARDREWTRHDVFPDVITANLIEAIHVVVTDEKVA